MRETFKSPPQAPEGVWSAEGGRFLIDGFPRKMDQALKFDESVSAYLTLTVTDVEEGAGVQVVLRAVHCDYGSGHARAVIGAGQDVG